jgi:DNA ligase (NAD+)
MLMASKDLQERAAHLRSTINHHRYLYHVLNQSEISEAALDSLKDELKKLESAHPELVTPDSPTQRVAGEALPEFQKIAWIQNPLTILATNAASSQRTIPRNITHAQSTSRTDRD